MAVTFRGAKGQALTHAEIDQNFSEFVLSGSVSNTTLSLFKSSSNDNTIAIELPKAGGQIGNVQLKKDDQGNWEGVSSFNYKWWDQELFISASTFQKGNIYLDGTIYAHQFETTLVSSSILYKSGSTRFGDSLDDTHIFTGSIRSTRDIVSNNDVIADGGMQAGTILAFNNITADGDIYGTKIYGETDFNTQRNKPTLVSSSIQIGITDTTDHYNYSGSVHDQREARLTALSQSTALVDANEKASRVASIVATNNSITALSSSAHTRRDQIVTALELADAQQNLTLNASITALSSSTALVDGTEKASRIASIVATNNSITALSSSIESSRLKNTTDTLEGDLTVTGTITAQEFNTEYITSSVIFESGSTKFGNTSDDTHDFTGTLSSTGNIISSADISGSELYISNHGIIKKDLTVEGDILTDKVTVNRDLTVNRVTTVQDLVVNGTISGTVIGNSVSASYATTASYAAQARTAQNAVDADYAITSSYATNALTASYALNAGSALTSETDPIFTASPAFGIAQVDIDDWDTVAGWGNHQDEGYAVETRVEQNYLNIGGTNSMNADISFGANTGMGLNFGEYNTGYSVANYGYIKYYNTSGTHKLEFAVQDELEFTVDGTSRAKITDKQAFFSVPIECTQDIVAYASSDERFKDNITAIANPIDKLKAIGGYTFDWNNNQDTYRGRDIGVVAQEIQAVLPEIVVDRADGFKAVRYEKLVALLIEVAKDQQLQIDELKAKL